MYAFWRWVCRAIAALGKGDAPRRQRRQKFSGQVQENRRPWPLFPVWWNALKFPLYCLAYAAAGGCRLSLPDSSVALRRQFPFHGSLLRFRTMSPLKGEVGAKRAEGLRHGEFGNSNLWFLNSSPEPAAATGCRLSLPADGKVCSSAEAVPTEVFRASPKKPKKSTAPIYGGRFRVLLRGSQWNRALPGVTPPPSRGASAARSWGGRCGRWGWRRSGRRPRCPR